MDHAVTTDEFKAAMAEFSAGVTVITTVDPAGRPFALTATAFSSVSKNPPLCLVCVSHDADAYPAIRAVGRYAVNILSRTQDSLSTRFATHGIDKFAGVDWSPGEANGCPLLVGALATIECAVTATLPAGDHDVFLGSILGIQVNGGEPLVHFHSRYWDLAPR